MEAYEDQYIITRVLDVFARKLPISLLETLVALDVVCYMDRIRLNVGRNGLETWFHYMHAKMREHQISIDIDPERIEMVTPGCYNVSGAVTMRGKNSTIETRRFAVTYLLEKGRITKIWSTRTNYVGIVGKSISLPLYIGYIYHLLRASYYKASGIT